MYDWQERTAMLVGEEMLEHFRNSTVAVIGVGGVGGYAAEMIVRAGVGHLIILDSDDVSVTNKNRQLLALDSTVGKPKCEVLAARLYGLNPDTALERTCAKFRRRFTYLEEQTIRKGRNLKDMTLAEMDAIWDEGKAKGL